MSTAIASINMKYVFLQQFNASRHAEDCFCSCDVNMSRRKKSLTYIFKQRHANRVLSYAASVTPEQHFLSGLVRSCPAPRMRSRNYALFHYGKGSPWPDCVMRRLFWNFYGRIFHKDPFRMTRLISHYAIYVLFIPTEIKPVIAYTYWRRKKRTKGEGISRFKWK